MALRRNIAMEGSLLLYSLYVLLSWFGFVAVRRAIRERLDLSGIPTAGYSGILTSYITAIQYLVDANTVLQSGYKMYKGRLFKIAQIDRWIVIATGQELLDDLRSAPENVLSMEAAMVDLLQSDYILGSEIRHDTYHLGVIRTAMNKNLNQVLPDILDETVSAFSDLIDAKLSGEDWVPIPATETFKQIVCRAVNRSFVGLPLCRNKDYCQINIKFTGHVIFGAVFVNVFPGFLKPIAGTAYVILAGLQERMTKHLFPLIEERRRRITQSDVGEDDKLNDMLTWLMDAATPGQARTAESLSLRMLNVNFMALHSTTMTFTHALYHLASKPIYLSLLREELEANMGPKYVFQNYGLDEDDLGKCWRLDSFLKESQRMNGLGALSLPRKALVPFRFSDGSVIPVGTIVAAAPTATHYDEELYDNPTDFDGFRFSRAREQAAANGGREEEFKHRLTSTGLDYLAFGGGRHTCPGRFLAALEMKYMLAHVILNYDVKMANEGVRPLDEWFGPMCVPSQKAEVLFRRRRHSQSES